MPIRSPLRWPAAAFDSLIRAPLAEADRAAGPGVPNDAHANRRMMIVMISTALCLTCIQYLSRDTGWVVRSLHDLGLTAASDALQAAILDPVCGVLWQRTIWVAVLVVFYAVVPALVSRLLLRQTLRDQGVTLRGVTKGLPVYAALFAVMVPVAVVMSGNPHFLATYPMCGPLDPAHAWHLLLWWEAIYFVQFGALEYFFRGFMVHGAKARLGGAAVFVMVVPYTMIHFAKPMPECVAAVVAGIVLGCLSLKTKSIWPGVALHCGVAATMDIAAICRHGW